MKLRFIKNKKISAGVTYNDLTGYTNFFLINSKFKLLLRSLKWSDYFDLTKFSELYVSLKFIPKVYT
jgi:hypothetical protein